MIKKWNDKIEQMNKKCELLLVVLLSFGIVLAVTMGIGTFFSGFHLVDDHEYLEWTYRLSQQGVPLGKLLGDWLLQDLSWRYEPVYYAMRILGTAVMGPNLYGFSLFKILQIGFSGIFLYYIARMMGSKKTYAVLFELLSLIGYQSCVWWKLGPQEAQGTFWFTLGFMLMLLWFKKKHWMYAASSLFAFFVMCNYKESFILLLPFLVCMVIYETMARVDLSKLQDLSEAWYKKALAWTGIIWQGMIAEKLLWFAAVLTGYFVLFVGIILVFVGANDYSGVGINPEATLSIYKEATLSAATTDQKWYWMFGLLFVMILLTYWDELKKLWPEMVLTVAFLLPQFVIFAQSGIKERYMLPSAIGYAFFFCLIIGKWEVLKSKRRVVYTAGLILLLLAHIRAMGIEAKYYTYRGQGVTQMLEMVNAYTDEHPDAKILSCFSPNEEGNLTIKYYSLLQGHDNLYYWHENEEKNGGIIDRTFFADWDKYEDIDLVQSDIADMDMIVMYNREDRHFCDDPSIDFTGFKQIECNTLTLWVRE